MPRTLARTLVAALLSVSTLLAFGASLTVAAPPTPAPPPPTLTGVQMQTVISDSFLFDFPCVPGSSTVTFTVSGTTTDPYSGTFVETGNLTYDITSGTPTFHSGTVTDYSATFSITSDTGTVTGSTALDTTAAPASVTCGHHSPTAGFIVTALPTAYSAVIGIPNGNYQDTGATTVNLSWERGGQRGQILTSSFTESPLSGLMVPTLIVPTSKDDCKDSGWQNFPQFQNQGDCVRYVESRNQ